MGAIRGCKSEGGGSTTMSLSIEDALAVLQHAVRERYGDTFDTEAGAGTITIAHDRVEITNAGSKVVADGLEGVTAELRVLK